MSKIKGGLYGLLIGSALGVPYEAHSPNEIPSLNKIEFEPPDGFSNSHKNVLPGTWSNNGAQALCLLESLISCEKLNIGNFANNLLEWYNNGKWSVDVDAFTINEQTKQALISYKSGTSPKKSGDSSFSKKDNGDLARVLPLALVYKSSDEDLVNDAHKQSLITHGHICNQVCCALYCLTAKQLLEGYNFADGYNIALNNLRKIYMNTPLYQQELEFSIQPENPFIGQGTKYVADCLKSSFMVIGQTNSYESAVKSAIALGNDTDTTACVVGGLAGIIYGIDAIPTRWMNNLRKKNDVANLLELFCKQ